MKTMAALRRPHPTRWVITLALGVTGCSDRPVVRPGETNLLVPQGRTANDYQAETSVAVVAPGINQACLSGAVVVGFNSRGSFTSGADPYLRIAGVAVLRAPLTATAAWTTAPQSTLTDFARAQLPDVRQNLGDPHLVAVGAGRVLYSWLASSSNADPRVEKMRQLIRPDRLAVQRSDDCGATWTSASVPLPPVSVPGLGAGQMTIDRPTMTVDVTNPRHIYIGFDATGLFLPDGVFQSYSAQYISESLDNGETWSTATIMPTAAVGLSGLANSPVMASRPTGGLLRVWAVQNVNRAGETTFSYFSSTSPTPLIARSWGVPRLIAGPFTFRDEVAGDAHARNDWQPAVAVAADDMFTVAIPEFDRALGGQMISLYRSTDRGLSWAFNAVSGNAGADAMWPVLVAGSSQGRTPMILAYYAGTRANPSRIDVLAIASATGGASWGDLVSPRPSLRNAPPFRPILDGSDNYFGDYFAGAVIPDPTASFQRRFVFVWMDSRDGATTRLYSNTAEVIP